MHPCTSLRFSKQRLEGYSLTEDRDTTFLYDCIQGTKIKTSNVMYNEIVIHDNKFCSFQIQEGTQTQPADYRMGPWEVIY